MSGAAAKFEAMAKTPEFQTALDYALLQLESEMPLPQLPAAMGPYGACMLGARRVLEILLELHKPEPEPPKPRRGLDYAVLNKGKL